MITRDHLIAIGRYNKAHGVDGEISATLDMGVDDVEQFKCLITDVDGIYVPFFVTSVRGRSATNALLRLEGIGSDTEAALLGGHDIYVLKSDYDRLATDADSDDDEWPFDYFIGFEVRDDDNLVGRVVDVDDSTENVLFVVERPDGGQVLLPAVEPLITSVDVDERTLTMHLPEGILNL